MSFIKDSKFQPRGMGLINRSKFSQISATSGLIACQYDESLKAEIKKKMMADFDKKVKSIEMRCMIKIK